MELSGSDALQFSACGVGVGGMRARDGGPVTSSLCGTLMLTVRRCGGNTLGQHERLEEDRTSVLTAPVCASVTDTLW